MASQFNVGDWPGPFTVAPGDSYKAMKHDRTQAPQAHLAYPTKQLETFNRAANLGFNGLIQVLSDSYMENGVPVDTRTAVRHGYLTCSGETPDHKNFNA